MMTVATIRALRGLAIVVAAFAMLVVYVANPLAQERKELRGVALVIGQSEYGTMWALH